MQEIISPIARIVALEASVLIRNLRLQILHSNPYIILWFLNYGFQMENKYLPIKVM